ncbi:MAG: hypothetical protein LBQ52_07355, partial [Helicobacteraceae bacterium]|nr:hypothetical protein [Helicobacteraceae bacterium]
KSLAAELARDLGEVFKHLEDYPNAIKWFEIAHNDGDKLATFMLGLMYERELKDYPNAIKWYMLAGNEQKRIDEILAKEALSQQESNSTISSDLNSSK